MSKLRFEVLFSIFLFGLLILMDSGTFRNFSPEQVRAQAPPTPIPSSISQSSNTSGATSIQSTQNLIYVPGEVIVKFKPTMSSATAQDVGTQELLEQSTGVQISEIKPLLRLEAGKRLDNVPVLNQYFKLKIPLGADVELTAQKLTQESTIEFAVPNYIGQIHRTPNDPGFNQQWVLKNSLNINLGFENAWDITTGSPGVVVAVLDTGYDVDHPDLDAKKTAIGRNFVANPDNSDIQDDEGHGTSVAGIIAAESNNGQGVTGVSWGAMIMPVKVCNNNGFCESDDVINGIYWATQNGAKVINLSLGIYASGFGRIMWQDAVNSAHSAKVIVVASAGNNVQQLDNTDATHYVPAELDHVIVVGATNKDDKVCVPNWYGYSANCKWGCPIPGGIGCNIGNDPPWGSGYGSLLDIVAPGSSDILTTANGGGYISDFGGTSASAPIVSGLAALMLSVKSDLTPDNVEQIIKNTAHRIGPLSPVPHSLSSGYGRINAYEALRAIPIKPYLNFSTGINRQISVEIVVTSSENHATKLVNEIVTIDSQGFFLGNLPLNSITRASRYDFHLKPSGYLRKTIPNIRVVDGGVALNPRDFKAGDINNDNFINVSDLLFVLQNWSSTQPIYDVDGNGTVGSGDLLLILQNWGEGDSWQDKETFTSTSLAATIGVQDLSAANTLSIVANRDFELGPNGDWTEASTNYGGQGGLIRNSGFSVTPRSGSWLTRLGAANNETSDLSQTFNLPSGNPIYLHYWYQISSSETECLNDLAFIRVEFNGEYPTGTIHNLCQSVNTNDEWALGTLNLSAFAGQTVIIHFQVETNAAISSSFFVDDVSFSTTGDARGKITLTPDTGVFNVGNTFNVQVRLDTGNYDPDVDVRVLYDPGVLQVQGDTEPNKNGIQVIKGTMPGSYRKYDDYRNLGEVRIGVDSVSKGNGTLAIIPFKAIASISNTTLKVYYRDGWTADSNTIDGDTIQDVLEQAGTASFQINGSPNRLMPTVSFTPANGTTLNSSEVELEIQATDAYTQVKAVKFEVNLNGPWIEIGSDIYGLDGWNFIWDTSIAPDGNYQLRATAYLLGGEGTSVTNSNIVLDRESPTYLSSTFTTPFTPSVGVPVTIEVATNDIGSGVDYIDVYVNSANNGSENGVWDLIGSIPSNQGNVVWDTTGYSSGVHRIALDIHDKAGNRGPSPQPQLFFNIGGGANNGNEVFLPIILK